MNLDGNMPKVIIYKIKSYVFFSPKENQELKKAVNLWCNRLEKRKAYKLYGHISLWDTKHITNMDNLFKSKIAFNSVISSWNVKNVKSMTNMFNGAKLFNQPLNNWDVSNVTNMNRMFEYAISFNQPLNNWDVSNVTNM